MTANRRHRNILATPLLLGLFASMTVAAPPAEAQQPASRYTVAPVTVIAPDPNAWRVPVTGYRLTGRFGNVSSLWAHAHTGLDFAAPEGTRIRAVAAGVVIEAGWAGAYGQRTIVRLADGTEVWYCHQSDIRVTVGQQVASGQVIGRVGSTGNVTGAHLHLEVRPAGGDPVDPLRALRVHGARL